MIIHVSYPSYSSPIILKSLGKLSPKFDLFHMFVIGNDELATYFDQITVGELSKVNGT